MLTRRRRLTHLAIGLAVGLPIMAALWVRLPVRAFALVCAAGAVVLMAVEAAAAARRRRAGAGPDEPESG